MEVFFSASQAGIQNGLNSQSLRAANVANINTTGYKSKSLLQSENSPGTTRTDFQPASFSSTSNPMDVTVVGRGFIELESKGGTPAYTRNIQLQVQPNGELSDSRGNRIPTHTPITPGQSVLVSEDGTLFSRSSNGDQQEIGKLMVVDFNNPAGLEKQSDNTYLASAQSGTSFPANSNYKVAQGYLENSNADLATDQVGMMTDSAQVKANINAIKAQDEMLGDLLDIMG